MAERAKRVSFFCSREDRPFPWEARFSAIAERLLDEEKVADGVNVVLCDDAEVRRLNKEYRKLDKVTDVLSFVWNDPGFLGEIFIAKDQVQRQAPEFGNTYYAELKRVLVHGLFHLAGYDHIKAADRKKMRTRELDFLGIDHYE